MNEIGTEGAQDTEAKKLKENIRKTLEDLRPFTNAPLADQLPKGVSEDQWKDMKNLTDLLDLISPKKPETPQVATPKQNLTPPST